ncbi:MAG: MBOAT family O-acyltransferase, partial [Ferrovibrio sp.]
AMTVDEALYLIFGFSFRIYFDFYAYSIMAIGMGLLLGIELPVNFRRPYEALNPRDFWQRWHISLSTWIRDYLYLPFGGNQAYVRNIIVVFALCGLWHGAGWNFVFWGLYHAVLLIGYRAASRHWDALPTLLQRMLLFILVSIGWLTFMFEIDGVYSAIRSLVGMSSASGASVIGWYAWAILLASAVICWAWNIERMADAIAVRSQWYRLAGGALGSVFIALLLLSSQSTSFIYFRF